MALGSRTDYPSVSGSFLKNSNVERSRSFRHLGGPELRGHYYTTMP